MLPAECAAIADYVVITHASRAYCKRVEWGLLPGCPSTHSLEHYHYGMQHYSLATTNSSNVFEIGVELCGKLLANHLTRSVGK